MADYLTKRELKAHCVTQEDCKGCKYHKVASCLSSVFVGKGPILVNPMDYPDDDTEFMDKPVYRYSRPGGTIKEGVVV